MRHSQEDIPKIHFSLSLLVLRYSLVPIIHKKCNIGHKQPTMPVVQLIVVIIHSLSNIVLTIREACHTIPLNRRIHLQQTNLRTIKFDVCNKDDKLELNIPNVSLHFISPPEKKKIRQDRKENTHTHRHYTEHRLT